MGLYVLYVLGNTALLMMGALVSEFVSLYMAVVAEGAIALGVAAIIGAVLWVAVDVFRFIVMAKNRMWAAVQA